MGRPGSSSWRAWSHAAVGAVDVVRAHDLVGGEGRRERDCPDREARQRNRRATYAVLQPRGEADEHEGRQIEEVPLVEDAEPGRARGDEGDGQQHGAGARRQREPRRAVRFAVRPEQPVEGEREHRERDDADGQLVHGQVPRRPLDEADRVTERLGQLPPAAGSVRSARHDEQDADNAGSTQRCEERCVRTHGLRARRAADERDNDGGDDGETERQRLRPHADEQRERREDDELPGERGPLQHPGEQQHEGRERRQEERLGHHERRVRRPGLERDERGDDETERR